MGETIMPMDGKRRLSREICVFRLGDSDRRFWVAGPLPLKDGEVEEDGGERKKGDRHKDKEKDKDDRGERHKDKDEQPSRREKDRERDRRDDRKRSRSRRGRR